MTMTKMENIGVRLPSSVMDYLEEKSEEKAVPKSTLIRMFVVERVKAEDDFSNDSGGDNYE